jgi:hypothetical protein
MADYDILGGNPDAEKILGIYTREPCRSSFEFDTLARSYEAMTKLREEFGRDDSPVFIEEDAPEPEPPAPLDEMEHQLRDLENAIIGAAAKLWQHRIAIARATADETRYRQACLADGIDPGF